jgi:hypothetical protein
MRLQKLYLILFTITFSLIFSSCSLSFLRTEAQAEADNQIQKWLNNSFIKCGDNFVTNYKGSKISVYSDLSSMENAYFQFKEVSYEFQEIPLTESDKLNGIEWKGILAIQKGEPLSRYLGADSYIKSNKWSEWKTSVVMYMDDFKKFERSSQNIPATPFILPIKKAKGKWEFTREFNKPACSEIPQG